MERQSPICMYVKKPKASFVSFCPEIKRCVPQPASAGGGGTTAQMLLWHSFPRVWVSSGMCNTNCGCKVYDFGTKTRSSSKTSVRGNVLQWPDNNWPQCEHNAQIYNSKRPNKFCITLQLCKVNLLVQYVRRMWCIWQKFSQCFFNCVFGVFLPTYCPY